MPSLSRTLSLLMTAAFVASVSPSFAQEPGRPPLAAKKPHVVESPNGNRDDAYYWLRDDTRQDPEMLAYLKSENAWFAQYAARYKGLEDKLFRRSEGRIKQDDSTVPARKGDWWYYTRLRRRQGVPGRRATQGGATDDPSASRS